MTDELAIVEEKEISSVIPERTGCIIWVSDLKSVRNLEKYGTVHYVSRKMHYVVMYMDATKAEDIMKNMARLSYVRKVERSYRNEIKTEYSKDMEEESPYYNV